MRIQLNPTARARVWRLQSDAALCDAAAHEHELAFAELYRRHYRDLRAFVFHFLGARHRHEDAEDVVQDAFVRAFDAIRDGRFDGDFRRWIFTVARNRSIDLLRGERVRAYALRSTAPAVTAPDVAETHEEVAWLVAVISGLPERQRSALLLRELAGLPHEAIADELETTPAAVRQLISRGRDGVRDAAERDGRERAQDRGKSLRRDLLDAAPALPLAATGLIASTGATAGGSLAVGKLFATVLATLIVAGTAGTVGREVADASGTPNGAAQAQPVVLEPAENASRSSAAAGKKKLTVHTQDADPAAGARSKSEKHDATGAPEPTTQLPAKNTADTKSTERPESSNPPPEPAKPVKKIVELPGKVVEHVADGLNGSSPPDQVVGNVLTDVTDTLGEATSGLLGSGSGSGAH